MTLEEKKAAARARARAAKEARAAGAAQVDVSDAAVAYIRQAAQEQDAEAGVRLRILAGGCSGLEYRARPPDSRATGRRTASVSSMSNGVRLLMDLKSSIHVTGSVIDYESTLLRRGFKLKNPNATSTCSCGDSFGV